MRLQASEEKQLSKTPGDVARVAKELREQAVDFDAAPAADPFADEEAVEAHTLRELEEEDQKIRTRAMEAMALSVALATNGTVREARGLTSIR